MNYQQTCRALDALKVYGVDVNPNTCEVVKLSDFLEVNAAQSTGWTDLPSQEQLEGALAQADDAVRVQSIKDKASGIILARYPLTKQLNMQARFSELLFIGVDILSPDETIELNALLAVWEWIKAVRAESNRLEADAQATENWPA